MSKAFEYSIGLRCLKKHREVDWRGQQNTSVRVPAGDYNGRSGGASRVGCVPRQEPSGGPPGDPVRKIEAPLVIPRVTSVAVDGG